MSNLCIQEFLTTIIHCSRVYVPYISLPGSLNIIIQLLQYNLHVLYITE